ncbi:MAG: PTS sugar transporter subunit IIA [Planctomycetota bacterium]
MGLADILREDLVKLELEAVSREGVAAELVQLLVASGCVQSGDAEPVIEMILLRERLGSTAVGKGLAFLRAETDLASECIVAVGRSTAGVEMGSLDGEPTHLVFLVLGHRDGRDTYLSILKQLSLLLEKKDPCERILAAGNAKELLEGICHRS